MKYFAQEHPATSFLLVSFLLFALITTIFFPSTRQYLVLRDDVFVTNEWWRILTAGFLHSGLIHILANMYAIYAVGTISETKFGSFNFLLCFLIGNIITYALFSKFFSFTSSVGASPGIYACLGCTIVLFIFDKEFFYDNTGMFRGLVIYFILGNFIALTGKQLFVWDITRQFVHGVGFLFGVVFGLFLQKFNL